MQVFVLGCESYFVTFSGTGTAQNGTVLGLTYVGSVRESESTHCDLSNSSRDKMDPRLAIDLKSKRVMIGSWSHFDTI